MVSRETIGEGDATLSPEEVGRQLDLAPASLARLRLYADLLIKWQAKINLVSKGTLPDLWRRHILDSAQLFRLLPPGPVLDLGSGAGFPGLVLAILRGGEGAPIHLAEVDQRKSAFLREAARVTGAQAIVHTERIERMAPFPVTTITARALAPLASLLEMAENFLFPGTHCLFLKGRGSEEELTGTTKDWMMQIERIPSLADPSGLILHLSEVHRGREKI